MASENTIKIYKNEDITLPFRMVPPQDISDFALVFTVRKDPTDPNVLISVDAVIMDGTEGLFNVDLQSADTNLPAGQYFHDVQRVDAGSHRVLSIGPFIVMQDVRTGPTARED